ncbi:MAG: hypothetical protein AAF614_29840 [Chloroflexota bacterium]
MYKLNAQQKELLRILVRLTETGKLKEPIIPLPSAANPTHFTIYLQGEESFRFKRLSDLDALSDAGLILFKWNRMGTSKLYYLAKEASTAVSDNFGLPPTPIENDVDLVELVQAMSGGRVRMEEWGAHLDLAHVAHDPVMRHTAVQNLVDRLLRFAQFEMGWGEYVRYEKKVSELRSLLLSSDIENGRLHTLAQELAFPETAVVNLTFNLKAWVYLYPLLLVGSARLEKKEG